MQAIEKFAENVARIKTSLAQLCTRLQETEFPNDVVQTESLRSDHLVMRQEFSEDLESTVNHGEALRDCLADETADGDVVKHRTELRQDRLEHVDAVDRCVDCDDCCVTWTTWTGVMADVPDACHGHWTGVIADVCHAMWRQV